MEQKSIELKIKELNSKNETKDGYSLGDVLLLQHYESKLKDLSWTKEQIQLLSPSYYNKG